MILSNITFDLIVIPASNTCSLKWTLGHGHNKANDFQIFNSQFLFVRLLKDVFMVNRKFKSLFKRYYDNCNLPLYIFRNIHVIWRRQYSLLYVFLLYVNIALSNGICTIFNHDVIYLFCCNINMFMVFFSCSWWIKMHKYFSIFKIHVYVQASKTWIYIHVYNVKSSR